MFCDAMPKIYILISKIKSLTILINIVLDHV